MKRPFLAVLLCVAISSMAGAAAPVPINEALVPIKELALEVDSRVAELETLLSSEETFNEKKGAEVRRAFGVLACIGQAIAEHEEAGTVKIQGAALRDAALLFKKASTFAEAEAALVALKPAQAGTSTVTAEKEHPWNKLINLHPMMDEIKARGVSLTKSFEDLHGTDEEASHASVSAVLALAMRADTHEVKNPADLPKWNEWAVSYFDQMHKAAGAVRSKDVKGAAEFLDGARQNCKKCHEVFRH